MSTTPAMKWPLPSVMPDAVRNSVSMRSLITGARAGINALSSSSLALCQAALAANAAWPHRDKTASHRKTQNGLGLVKVHDSPLQRGSRGLGAIGHAQFAEQAVDVGLHRGLRDAERGSNLFVAVSSHDQLQHLGFARGQGGGAHALRLAFGDRIRDTGLAGIDG